jgi:hypothetical protein
MSSIAYVAYCLDCDTQLGESEVKTHKCLEEEADE